MDLLSEQRREREERILAAARELIAEVGYDGVTIRALARRSRVSVPTLYKLFGDKDALLMNAVEDQFTFVLRTTLREPAREGLDLILALIDGCAREMLRTPTYSRAVLAVFVRSGRSSEVTHRIGSDLRQALARGLAGMADTDELEDWVEPEVLAERLAAHQLMVCLEWESGALQSKALCPTMLYGACMMLLSVTRGPGRARLESLLRHAQPSARASGAGPGASRGRDRNSERR